MAKQGEEANAERALEENTGRPTSNAQCRMQNRLSARPPKFEIGRSASASPARTVRRFLKSVPNRIQLLEFRVPELFPLRPQLVFHPVKSRNEFVGRRLQQAFRVAAAFP